jgi:agmatinase
MEFKDDGFASYGGLAYENVPIDEVDVLIQGIPYDGATSGKKGTSLAPSALRLASADLQTMTRDGKNLENIVVRDMGNIPVFPLSEEKTRDSIEKYFSFLLDNSSAPVFSIGGDHSVVYPLLKSLSKNGKVAIIWFDAHRDLLPELMGSKFSHASPLLRAIELDTIDPKNVLLVGTRYMTADEQDIVDKHKIEEYRMVDMENDNFNIEKFRDKILRISSDVDFVYVSIDIDVLDPAFAPGTGTPVGGGLTTSQLMRYIRAIPVKVRAMDIVEVSPPYDNVGITIKATMGLLTEIIAKLTE